jgi:chlorobactene glucosyltransferase
MIIIYGFSLLCAVFLIFQTVILLINVVSEKIISPYSVNQYPPAILVPEQELLSILIPARNEADRIGALLDDLLRSDYENLEILVYDDASTDSTADIIRRKMSGDSRIRLLSGSALPEGWGGKNHACHRLALEARGRYFLFLDADVRLDPNILPFTVDYVKRYDLTLLSLFPWQDMESLGEKATVPSMYWVLLSLLPLPLVRRSPNPAFSAANGQFMLFDAPRYRYFRFHEQVRHFNVEDILISRWIKKQGLKIDVKISEKNLRCRMYTGYRAALSGFSRSLFQFFGGSVVATLLFTLITTGAWTLWLFPPSNLPLGSWGGFLCLFLAWNLRLLIAVKLGLNLIQGLILGPLQQLSWLGMVTLALFRRFRGKNVWKNRTIVFK